MFFFQNLKKFLVGKAQKFKDLNFFIISQLKHQNKFNPDKIL